MAPVQRARRRNGLMAGGTRALPKRTKFIFVSGGVVSSLGKGLASASIGSLLEARGLKITIQKLDPYLNVDPGTMNPMQHGEVFVTDDGAETDLDLGHYERFLSQRMSRLNNATSGQIYFGHPERAARRIPGRHRAGDPARHRRDQERAFSSAPRTWTCSSSRSAARSATSNPCPSSRRSASCASRWATRTPSRST